MNKEKEYLEHKRKTLIDLVNIYNYRKEEFKIDVENLNIIESFCSYSHCASCGQCCSKGPCIYSPRDFLDITDLDYMRKILNTGVVTIIKYDDFWETLIIRNRGIYDKDSVACEDVFYDLAYNPCLLIGKNGCMLPDVYRASQGLLYVAKNGRHWEIYDEERAVAAYGPYQKELGILYNEYKDVIIPKSSDDIYDQKRGIHLPKEPISEESVNQFIKCLINKK